MKEHCACQLPIVAPGRRAFLAALAFTAVSPTVALTQTGGSGAAADVRFMRMALEEARQADFPFGAVIVREGAAVIWGERPATQPRTAKWWRSGAVSPITATRRCAAARSTPPANPVRCA